MLGLSAVTQVKSGCPLCFSWVVAPCSLSQIWPGPGALVSLYSVLALDLDSIHAPSSSPVSATLTAG